MFLIPYFNFIPLHTHTYPFTLIRTHTNSIHTHLYLFHSYPSHSYPLHSCPFISIPFTLIIFIPSHTHSIHTYSYPFHSYFIHIHSYPFIPHSYPFIPFLYLSHSQPLFLYHLHFVPLHQVRIFFKISSVYFFILYFFLFSILL